MITAGVFFGAFLVATVLVALGSFAGVNLRLTQYLQSKIGVAINGLILVSPALAPDAGSSDLSPIPWMLTLPSIVAANTNATVLAIVSGTALVVGAGSLLWLLHLEDQHAGGFSRVELDAEQGGAISLLVAAVVAYLVARISGLALAPDATHAYNDELRERLGLPPPEPLIPFHALAPVPTLTFRF